MPSIKKNFSVWEETFKSFLSQKNFGDSWSEAWGSPLLQWYSMIFPRLYRYLPSTHIYEIASGLGRWSFFLQYYSSNITLSDISNESINFLKDRFKKNQNIKCYINDGKKIISDNKLDLVFTFDSLVHCDYEVIKSYVLEFKRLTKANSVFFLHHSNLADCLSKTRNSGHNGWRSDDVSSQIVAKLCDENDLQVIYQEVFDWGSVKDYLDCISVIAKDSDYICSNIKYNNKLMKSAFNTKKNQSVLTLIYNLIFYMRKKNLITVSIEGKIIDKINQIFKIYV